MAIQPSPGHLSHSQIAALLPSREGSCALRWGLKYRLGFQEAPSLAMELGSALDAGLNTMLSSALFGRGVDLQKGREELAARLDLIPDSLADAEARKAEGKALDQALLLFWERHQDWQGQDVQFRFEVEWKGQQIVGVIDRVDADGTIVDHKLTRSQRAKDGVLDPEWVAERRHQLALYLACMALASEQPVGTWTKAALEVCYATARLKTPQWTVAELVIPPAEQEQALRDAETAAFVRDSGRLPAHPGKWCAWCEFQVPCQAVQSVLAPRLEEVAEVVLPGVDASHPEHA